MIVPWIFFAGCLFVPSVPVDPGPAGWLHVEVAVPPRGLPLGRPFFLVLRVEDPRAREVSFPEPPDLGPAFALLEGPVTMEANGPGAAARYTLLPLRSGPVVLPALSARSVAGRVFRSEPLSLPVRPPVPPGAPADLRIPDLLRTPSGKGAGGLAGLPLVLLAGAAAFLVGYGVLRRRRERTPARPPDPAEEALRALEGLRIHPVATLDDRDRFYVVLSTVLRTYLEARLGVPASRETTEEVASALAGRGDALANGLERIVACLHAADRGKFDPGRRAGMEPAALLEAAAEGIHGVEVRLRPPGEGAS